MKKFLLSTYFKDYYNNDEITFLLNCCGQGDSCKKTKEIINRSKNVFEAYNRIAALLNSGEAEEKEVLEEMEGNIKNYVFKRYFEEYQKKNGI